MNLKRSYYLKLDIIILLSKLEKIDSKWYNN